MQIRYDAEKDRAVRRVLDRVASHESVQRFVRAREDGEADNGVPLL